MVIDTIHFWTADGDTAARMMPVPVDQSILYSPCEIDTDAAYAFARTVREGVRSGELAVAVYATGWDVKVAEGSRDG